MNNNIIQINETQTSVRVFCIGSLPSLIEDWHKSMLNSIKENIKQKKNTKNENTHSNHNNIN